MLISEDTKIFVAGHNGMVGQSICRALASRGYTNIVKKNSSKLDLRNQKAVEDFFYVEKPSIVIDAAARVGGILANNNFPYQFLMQNLQIQNNLLSASLANNVEKFVFLGSSCIYPRLAPQPLKEEYLLTASLEPTNEWYALAKITGVKACEAIYKQFGKQYFSLMPTNLYGFHDNFDLNTSHVLPAMIRKFHDAKNKNYDVVLWGTGSPLREFLFVDDLADAVVFMLNKNCTPSVYNVGSGYEIAIKELAVLIKEIVGFEGEIKWDETKPDGTPRKLLDTSKINQLGWKSTTSLKEGILKTYNWFLQNIENYKEVKI